MIAKATPGKWSGDRYLEGQLLLAMPTMTDKRFRRAVIYMCRHSDDSAMGIIINQRAKNLTFPRLLKQLNLVTAETFADLPDAVAAKTVHVGGPVATERGFVLHSDDYRIDDSTLSIGKGFCLTATIDILKAIATGEGPSESILALGYSGWAGGQLESEIQANGWLHCPADKELIFGPDSELKYDRALFKIGIDPSHLVSEAGHA